MKRNTLLIAIVCLIAVCFTTFVACSGNVDNVDAAIDNVNKMNRFITVLTESTKEYTKVTEVLISDDKMQVLSIKTEFPADKNKPEVVTREHDNYYNVLKVNNEDVLRVYSSFECKKHAKGDKPVLEWKFEDKKGADFKNAITDAKTDIRSMLATFSIKGDKLEWSKEAKGFVFKSGNAPADTTISDVVVNANATSMDICYKQNNVEKKVSFMNFNTARVSFPVLCKDYADMLNPPKK